MRKGTLPGVKTESVETIESSIFEDLFDAVETEVSAPKETRYADVWVGTDDVIVIVRETRMEAECLSLKLVYDKGTEKKAPSIQAEIRPYTLNKLTMVKKWSWSSSLRFPVSDTMRILDALQELTEKALTAFRNPDSEASIGLRAAVRNIPVSGAKVRK